MKSSFEKIIFNTFLRQRRKTQKDLSSYKFAKEFRVLQVTWSHSLKDFFLISLGILSAGFGLKGFLLPNSFIDGGVTGISLLINEVAGISLSVLILVINIPFVVLGFTQIGKSFAIKSILAISGLALALLIIEYPVITSDKLLVAVFGGFFVGSGIGAAVRGGAVLDGTEVLAIYISKRTSLTIGDVILLFNIVIFSVASYLLSIETALYSILIYLIASKTVDFVIEGVEEYTGVTIVSSHNEKIRLMIIEQLGRGVTVYNGKGGYGKSGDSFRQTDILYTVTTRLEISKLQSEIDKIDPHAFIVMSSIKDTKGGMIKKRPFH